MAVAPATTGSGCMQVQESPDIRAISVGPMGPALP
jgi:hypothetical protein